MRSTLPRATLRARRRSCFLCISVYVALTYIPVGDSADRVCDEERPKGFSEVSAPLTAEAQALGARERTTTRRRIGLILAPHLASRRSGPARLLRSTRGPVCCLAFIPLSANSCPGDTPHFFRCIVPGVGGRGRAYAARTRMAAAASRVLQLTLRQGGETAGLIDRRSLFQWLLALGELLGADTAVEGGLHGPALYLSTMHSPVIASKWSSYFDTTAHHGRPFKRVSDRAGCLAADSPRRLAELYYGPRSWQCLNLTLNPYMLQINHSELAVDFAGVGAGLARRYVDTFHRQPPLLAPSRAVTRRVRRHCSRTRAIADA